jgi:hypothetical protein
MKIIDIRKKLEELGSSVSNFSLGDFDYIGRFTAERTRDRNSDLYNRVGAFYRSNYERGILITQLIKTYKIESMLEIGFGRGYSTICAAKTFHELGVNGKIHTIDPNFDSNHIEILKKVFPAEWFSYITFMRGTSKEILPSIKEKYDFVYIDGDHSYEGTKYDWESTKDKWNKCLLFDDYHLPTNVDPGIQCRELIDTIQDDSKELVVMDRRIFFDDRRIPDEKIDYGQVLLTNPDLKNSEW